MPTALKRPTLSPRAELERLERADLDRIALTLRGTIIVNAFSAPEKKQRFRFDRGEPRIGAAAFVLAEIAGRKLHKVLEAERESYINEAINKAVRGTKTDVRVELRKSARWPTLRHAKTYCLWCWGFWDGPTKGKRWSGKPIDVETSDAAHILEPVVAMAAVRVSDEFLDTSGLPSARAALARGAWPWRTLMGLPPPSRELKRKIFESAGKTERELCLFLLAVKRSSDETRKHLPAVDPSGATGPDSMPTRECAVCGTVTAGPWPCHSQS